MHLHTVLTFCGAFVAAEFDPADPGGAYTLNLARPYDRAVANELLRAVRVSAGYDEWQEVLLNGCGFAPPSMSIQAALMNEVMFPTISDIFGEPPARDVSDNLGGRLMKSREELETDPKHILNLV